MRQCPKCNQWTMDFDEYFGRFRCFNAKCSWMPSTAAERHLRLMQENKSPKVIEAIEIPTLQLTLQVFYDETNDTLIFTFNNDQPSFEFPSDDVRVLWNIGRYTGEVLGFVILGAKSFGVKEIELDIVAKREKVSESIKSNLRTLGQGKATKLAIDNVAVKLKTDTKLQKTDIDLTSKLNTIMERFSAEYISH